MANSGRVEIDSSARDSLRSVHRVVYVNFTEESEFPEFLGILAHAWCVPGSLYPYEKVV